MANILAAQIQKTRTSRYAHVITRGAVLSHLIGVCFFIAVIFDRVFPAEMAGTSLVQIPIRLVAIWMLIDRVGRYRHIKIGAWDYIHFFFVASYGLALVYAEVFMTRDTGFINYMSWISLNFNCYLYFVIVREGATRRGFNPEVVLRWLLVGLSAACVLALLQATNLAHMRDPINHFYHQQEAEAKMEGPSAPWQARGPAAHANTLAIMLVIGITIPIALNGFRRMRVVDYFMTALLLLTLFATYSRIGMVSIAIVAFSFIILLFAQKKYQAASLGMFTFLSLLAVFVMLVFAFDIQRYKVLVVGEGNVRNQAETGITGWYLRKENIRKAMELAEKYPLTGVNVATSAINQEGIIYKSAYSFEGLLLNVYAYAWVSYGLMGLTFIGGILWLTLGQFFKVRSNLAFPPALFVAGVALAVTGVAENSIFQIQSMIVVNVIMGLAVSQYRQPKAKAKKIIYPSEPMTEEELAVSLHPVR